MKRLRITLAFVLITCINGFGAGWQADSYVPDEYEIKAVFLYQFTKFIDWPSDAFPEKSAPVILGIYGDDPFGQYLDEVVTGETIEGRPLVVQRLTAINQLNKCHVVFISHSESKNLSSILRRLGNNSILTVGDTPGYAEKGVMINLFTRNRKIRFEINRTAAEQAGLKISSKLLNLANLVEASNGK
jgi:hypothetical protein